MVVFNAPHVKDLKRNPQQGIGQLAECKYKVVAVNGDEISLENVNG